MVLNPVLLQLYLVLLSQLPYLVAFYSVCPCPFVLSSISLSVYMSYPSSILNPISYVYVFFTTLCPSAAMV
jgi:hypothetical protein